MHIGRDRTNKKTPPNLFARMVEPYNKCVCVSCSVGAKLVAPTLCDPMDYNPSGSSVHGILQVRILEWVATSSSRGSSQPKSPALQADSLPAEPQVKPNIRIEALFQFQSIYMLSKIVFS